MYQNYEDEKGETRQLPLCLPWKLIKEVLESTHNLLSAGHIGSQKMSNYFWLRGNHTYKDEFQLEIHMALVLQHEPENTKDPHAVAITENNGRMDGA